LQKPTKRTSDDDDDNDRWPTEGHADHSDAEMELSADADLQEVIGEYSAVAHTARPPTK
jgi:hypothetical protein